MRFDRSFILRSRPSRGRARLAPAPRRAFTLLETALALVIVLVGVLAILEAQQSFVRSNSWSSHEATATYLAAEVRERMRNLPRHDSVTGLQLVTGGGAPTVQGLGPESGEITVDDYDDVDDYLNARFGLLGTLPGPIDAFGQVIPEVDADGHVVLDPQTGQPLPMQGWSQEVAVEKVDPYDFAQTRDWTFTEAASGNFVGRAVGQFPLRVTVSVYYQGPFDPQRELITTMSWITP